MKRMTVWLLCSALACSAKVPQFSGKDLTLLKRLQQQIKDHNEAACKQLCDQAADQHKKNQLSDEQYEAVHQVCEKIEVQRWDEAGELTKKLIEAQEKKE